MKRYCENCGAELPADSVFCEQCGTRVEEDPVKEEKAQARVPERKKTGRQGSGSPKAVLLILAVLIVAVLAFLLFREKGKGDPEEGQEYSSESPYHETAAKETKATKASVPETEVQTESTAPEKEADTTPQGIVDETESAASAGGSEIAAMLSTDEIAYATDFEWFLDCVLYDGNEAGRVITDPGEAGLITDDALSLNGGWKAFMCSDGKVYGSDVERYFNVEIDTDGNQFIMTSNWKYMYDPAAGSSIDETHTDTFEGKYQNGTATARSTYAQVDFDGFYLSADGKTEYATGTFHWISGEQDRIGLMRSVR